MVGMDGTTNLLSNRAADAREAMAALISSRSLSVHDTDPEFAATVAELAWKIADAMAMARSARSGGPPSSQPPRPGRRPR